VSKFVLWSLVVVLGFYAIGYYPSNAWDAPRGSLGLLSGLTLAFVLMTASFAVIRWALHKSQSVFLAAFGLGFLARLIIFIVLFFVYYFAVKQGVVTFAISFGVSYVVLSVIEFLVLTKTVTAPKSRE